ncbi:acetyltransferase (GNAT) family protein [Pigmentiphaga kullae]|uniref:Acetyltransferase (GNAT) family protein n=2 Tax=Pigmentiphaga kullae TaxID=151784 RepID=A0A4V2F471_9BURK|nr:acetyltransferase (GNAT) family protein [Pigmentiphaga kullae]
MIRPPCSTRLRLDRKLDAWDEMVSQQWNWILVTVVGDEVIGVLQLTLIPGLSRSGTKRAQIEGVRVKTSARGQSVGKSLMQFALAISREHGCGLVQLTTDKRRPDAKRFYESLGFEATHEGMKLVW